MRKNISICLFSICLFIISAIIIPTSSVAVSMGICIECGECAEYDYGIDATCCIRCMGDGNENAGSVIGGGGGGGSGGDGGGSGDGGDSGDDGGTPLEPTNLCAQHVTCASNATNVNTLTNCTSSSSWCYAALSNRRYFSCNECANGYIRTVARKSMARPCMGNSVVVYECRRYCDKGSYSSGDSCVACPSGGTTESAGAKDITQCYITSGSDSTGTYLYTENCYWSN